jgi:hypothetical protein
LFDPLSFICFGIPKIIFQLTPKQEPLTLQEYPGSSPVFGGVFVAHRKKTNNTNKICGAGTAHPSGAPEFIPYY